MKQLILYGGPKTIFLLLDLWQERQTTPIVGRSFKNNI